ncbi:tyrosine-type recombinase/integrase [Paraburkholderia kirstenboschensis]|uniref:Tyrosine-type recombinase/integrase n=1 Tax=Paraburkholderia kirstenboschensis TaxID=1245436 RepID=A0ABZ0EX02_9BURK|nr:tyrosine-type recombinase/integrase [Paraburkholderia kirstenboschensis]WOD20858.1 tyrosine-type recombinase/integrase [Paraburkholderia kirstenboschensis]
MTKNGRSRFVPLSSRAVEIISTLPRTDERVFPVSDYTVDCAWWRAIKRAGINDFNFHDLRHMATTRLAKKLRELTFQVAIFIGRRKVMA